MKTAAQVARAPRRKLHDGAPNRLAELRAEFGLTLRQVAEPLGVSHVTIANAEAGHDVLLSLALKLAQFYRRTVEDLWRV